MSQVFIAYKRADTERVAIVRQKLEALGVELFIDHQIKGGEDYLAVIDNELASALAVLVLWSRAAVAPPKPGEKNFIRAEAQKGWRRDVLVAATFDEVVLDNLPVPFNTFQTSDISDWFDTGRSANHRGWQRLLEALGAKIARPGLPTLALVLENGDERAKREFLKTFPNDIFAGRFADEIVGCERAAFEKAVAAAQAQIDRRRRDAEKILRDCRARFESQIASLRKGEDFVPPDPLKMLADEVTTVRDQNEICEAKIDELQTRVEDLKSANEQASKRIGELTLQLGTLGEHAAAVEAVAAEADRMKSDLQYLQRDGAAKSAELERRAQTNETLKASLAQAQQAYETGRHELKKLQSENAMLKSRLPGAPPTIWNSPRLLAATAGTAGALLGAMLVGPSVYLYDKGNNHYITSGNSRPLGKADAKDPPNSVLGQSDIEQIKAGTANALGITPPPKAAPQPPTNQMEACDSAAGDPYDRDLPKSIEGQKSLKGSLTNLLSICKGALDSAEANHAPDVDRRRLSLQVGRILAAQALQAAKANGGDAKALFDEALKAFKSAAKLKSGRAYYTLGQIYDGDYFSGTREFASIISYGQAWSNFEQAAKLGDPKGLTAVAFGLFEPDETNKMAKEDHAEGANYLVKALETDDPHARFLAGRAKLEGKLENLAGDFPGLPKDRSEAIRQIEIATCAGDDGARKYYQKIARSKPNCTQ